MNKRFFSILLALVLLVSVIPMSTLSVSAEVDEGGSALECPTPQNVQATLVGFVEASSGKALVVEIAWDALSGVDGGNKFVEMWPSLKQDANLSLPMSFEAWLGQATLIPVEELEEGGMGYVTVNGRSYLRSVVHILQPGELKVGEDGMANGVKENDVIDIDIYTAGWDPATQTDGESEHKHVEIVYTEENVKDKKTFTEEKPSECTHQNTESEGQLLNVKGNVTIDGKTTGVALVKESEKCTDCQKKKTTKVYRLRFKNRGQMMRYLSGRYAKLKNGKTVHFKGKVEKIERVYWNKKHIKVSKAYNKKKGSVILEFTDEFLATVEDGTHELMVCNGDEFTAMSVTVQNHEMVEIGAFDIEDHAEISADRYEALMQECEDEGIEVVDCDLDAFYADGFMVNADDVEVTMGLSAEYVPYTGEAVKLPAVTLTSDMGVGYTQDEDYSLTYYQIVEGVDGEEIEVEIDPEQIKDSGAYCVVATPTRNGVLFGEARAQFAVVETMPKILGDVDGDGEVGITDVTCIQRSLAGLRLPFELDPAVADADGDGEVTIVDAAWLRRWIAGLNAPETIGKLIPEEGERSVLVGSWAYEEDDNFIYTFDADGTGVYRVYDEPLNFSYVDNGSSVDILFDGEENPSTFAYTVDGDTLTIKDSTGADVVYKKN